ncbi:hypothetical protein B0I00_1897 [Novosphingobium kunmingense]|uniref:Lambda phage tail tube protein N-terminal domain-containing protein n=1 Tax=Novosphingobium kunmingense TaxID=1211806 RepID=A0A2N0HL17_9SPHN|nr:phage tail tube protein [Novosphingobium kunmingense]PKB19657.1 hypothetical protein B0I00_1897 [Novosphingobium kunmingense]
MADESTGWGGEFHLHNGTALTELVGVSEVGTPEVTVDFVDSTHLKSPDKFKEFLATLKEGSEFDVVMNYVPRSPTDLLCRAQLTQKRAFKIVEPDFDGEAVQDIDGTGLVIGYKPNPMTPGEMRTATLTIKVSGSPTYAASA